MAVPESVADVREQIKEALKLSLADGLVETILALDDPWTAKDSTLFPQAKVWAGASALSTEHFGKQEVRRDTMMIAIAPWCTAGDWEYEVSKLITGVRGYLDTERVRGFMHGAYAPYLGRIVLTSAEPIDTALLNPRGVCQVTLEAQYRITWQSL